MLTTSTVTLGSVPHCHIDTVTSMTMDSDGACRKTKRFGLRQARPSPRAKEVTSQEEDTEINNTRISRKSITVGRNLWICDIHGSACAIYGSILCAEIHGLRRYLWIAQGSCLRGPREIFAGPPAILSHTCLLCNFSCNISGQFALYVWSTIPHVSVRCEAEVRNNSNIMAGTCLERLP